MTTDLIAFLRARHDEELARAEAAAEEARSGDWRYRPGDDRVYAVDVRSDDTPGGPREDFFPLLTEAASYIGDQISDSLGEFVAEHDPVRVLREVAAIRAIVNLHAESDFPYNPDDGPGDYSWTARCDGCYEDDPCTTLRLLAAAYADHPDYREEWRPTAP